MFMKDILKLEPAMVNLFFYPKALQMATPQAILAGFTLVALAIASLPYSNGLISPALAADKPMKVHIFNDNGICSQVNFNNELKVKVN